MQRRIFMFLEFALSFISRDRVHRKSDDAVLASRDVEAVRHRNCILIAIPRYRTSSINYTVVLVLAFDMSEYSARAWACSPTLPPLSWLEPDRLVNGVSCLIICLALLDTHAHVHCAHITPAIRVMRKGAFTSKQELLLLILYATSFFISNLHRDINLLLNYVKSISEKNRNFTV